MNQGTGVDREVGAARRQDSMARASVLLARLVVAGMAAVCLGAVALLTWASRRGLDLTDEGIYLNIYRHWRNPELNFTGAPVIAGPLFQLLGWRVARLRIAKLVLLVGSAAFLGVMTLRHVAAHVPDDDDPSRREKHLIVVLTTILGSFSLYAWLPQTPGYNDLAIIFSAIVVALVLEWSLAEGRRATVLGVVTGALIVALFLVKWPSAIFISAGITGFVFASGRGCRFVPFLGACAGGGAVALLYAQLVGGNVLHRLQVIRGATDVVLQETSGGLVGTYLKPYGQNLIDVSRTVGRIAGPVVIVGLVVAGLLVWFGRRTAAGVVYAVALAGLSFRARRGGFLTGGEVQVFVLESTFPIFVAGTLGVLVLVAIDQRRRQGDPDAMPAPTSPVGSSDAATSARSLWAGLLLVGAFPLLQSLGTGNPMFRIAFAAGAGWSAAIAGAMLVAVRRGGRWVQIPALAAAGTMALIGLLTGVEGLRTDSFRVGALDRQTHAVPGSPALNGLLLDASAADLITKTREVLRREGFLGKPGFASMNGTGLTFALGMPAPLGGLFVEEPLPNVLRGRIAQACKIGAITPKEPPVVLSLGDGVPKATAGALMKCGINFPAGYRSERVTPVDNGYVYLRTTGITVWLPNP